MKTDTPMADAVKATLSEGGALKLRVELPNKLGRVYQIDVAPCKAGGWDWDIEYRGNGIISSGGWLGRTRHDAATALRDIAEKLKPDTERQAMEIAGNLAVAADKHGLSWAYHCFDVVGRLMGVTNKPGLSNIALVEELMHGLPDTPELSDVCHWLQQARDFFAQAEEETRDEQTD